MVVISTEWRGGCELDWFFDDYWVLQLEWNEEISRESERLGGFKLLAFGCWLLAGKKVEKVGRGGKVGKAKYRMSNTEY